MYQKLIIVGNLGRDPELRFTQSGQAVCNFSVATSRRWTGSDGQQKEETTWIQVSTWGKLAEVCDEYLSKGRQVMCEGRLTVDRETGGPHVWQAQDGSYRASYQMTAFEVKFLGGRDSNSGSAPLSEDEIPF